jgi:hypothetical protein
LNTIDWENADNPLACPFNNGNTGPNGALYMYHIPNADSTDNAVADSTQGLSITVFPNPSAGTFNFSITAGSPDNINIEIYSIGGSPVYGLKGQCQEGITQSLVWDASALAAGVYYYRARTSDGKSLAGKLVKM